jgi:membrane-anchored glycerophosphoryl diester phosphodiesterase (GDPDase)
MIRLVDDHSPLLVIAAHATSTVWFLLLFLFCVFGKLQIIALMMREVEKKETKKRNGTYPTMNKIHTHRNDPE